MLICRISRAAFAASSGVWTSLMPPDLPRLPVGTCAFTTDGPRSATAADACSAVSQTFPSGVGTPAGTRTCCLAAYSSRFIVAVLFSVTRPMRPEQFFLARLVLWNGSDEVRDIEEVFVIQVLGY